MRYVILDTETTGLDPNQGHRITEIGCLEMINRRLTGRRFQTYLNPEREVDKGAMEITGLTLEFLKDKPKFSEIAEEFLEFIQGAGTELIIHNAPFDMGFLNSELKLLGHAWSPLEHKVGVIDTLAMARRMHPGQRNNLDVLCKRYNIDNSHRELHGALLDAQLLAQLYLAMTAGQTDMGLGAEPLNPSRSEIKIDVKKVSRNHAFPLRIIRASEEELKLHLERLAEIRDQKA